MSVNDMTFTFLAVKVSHLDFKVPTGKPSYTTPTTKDAATPMPTMIRVKSQSLGYQPIC